MRCIPFVPAPCHACGHSGVSVYFVTLREANEYKRANPWRDSNGCCRPPDTDMAAVNAHIAAQIADQET